MPRHVMTLVLMLAIVASGCNTLRQILDRSPLTEHANEDNRDGAPTPIPAPVADSTIDQGPAKAGLESSVARRICEVTSRSEPGDYRLRERALMTAITSRLVSVSLGGAPLAIDAVADCLSVEPVPCSNGKMLVVHLETGEPEFSRRHGVAAWHHDGAWRTASLLEEEIGNGAVISRCRDTADGLEAIAELRFDGTGHFGAFQLYRFESEMTLLWEGELYDHFVGTVLDDHLLLGTYRDVAVWEEPHDRAANCCYPNNGQTLWERQGDVFVQKAVRLYPSAFRTASAFAGAWNRGRPELAAHWATDGTVLQAMLGDATEPPTIVLSDEPPDLAAVEATEAGYWEALPPDYRGPMPTITEFLWPATPRPLLLRRVDGQWKVAGWQ